MWFALTHFSCRGSLPPRRGGARAVGPHVAPTLLKASTRPPPRPPGTLDWQGGSAGKDVLPSLMTWL